MLRRDSEGGWIPGLMTDYQTNEDHTVHTLTLREGAKWSDGTDITVEDIVYSYQRALDPELGSAIAYRYSPSSTPRPSIRAKWALMSWV